MPRNSCSGVIYLVTKLGGQTKKSIMIILPNNGSIVTDSDVKRTRCKMCLETENIYLKVT